LNNNKLTKVIIYISVFLFHFLILFLISIVVKERTSSPNYYQEVELINIPEFKQIRSPLPKVVEEGTKESTDDKAKPEQGQNQNENLDQNQGQGGEESSYSGQFMAATAPIFPLNYIKSRIVYPPLAKQQGIQNVVVILELYIDKNGEIKKVNILKDPGFGFGEAVVKGLQDIKVVTAKDADGNPIAIKFRYPYRFVLD